MLAHRLRRWPNIEPTFIHCPCLVAVFGFYAACGRKYTGGGGGGFTWVDPEYEETGGGLFGGMYVYLWLIVLRCTL